MGATVIADLGTPADLDGRVALVTGGGSGIGRSTVRLLAARGSRVVAADLDVAGAKESIGELDCEDARAVEVDVTSPEQVDAMVAAAVDAFGRLDIAVNAAGVSGAYGNVADQEVDEWRRVVDVNLTSVFLCTRAELRHMAAPGAGGGVIVNVASAAGEMGVPGLAHYSASKHGVIGLTKSAALEYAKQGPVRVNAVLPGPIRTPMLLRFTGGDEGVDNLGRSMPIGRAGEPDEIAQAIAWLCSDQASYITGHTLAVDGGSLAT